jgi:hypothetical protein
MTLEDRLFFATRADAAFSFTCKDRPWENFEGVSIRLLNCGQVNLAMNEASFTVRALKHPVRHRCKISQLGIVAQYTGSCTCLIR